ncbi:hypothetical protein EDB81DRAFT_43321 [Dactylonectria macrodidyma]|uniref:Uncharacterized protein n=1 Tax=Dactylonectria macrodidyma TaxID=307937 RepID=A0A9P9FW18_9HYPO|nr:hypothetical protein EDB81DRAFT_43321 [Dactylonectria macrodidyma]
MATIEPRLIHLLNESTTPQLPHVDLPPLHSLPLPKSLDLPLPPLEPDSSHRGDRPDRRGTDGLALANPTGPLYLTADDSSLEHRKSVARVDGKHASTAAAFPLRLLLGETEAAEPSHSLNKILDDNLDSLDDASNKKRHRGLHVKDDFVQLPQPLKKQKAAQAAPVMPPIINGLHEPPPHAALFPPISSTSFDRKDGKQIKLLHELNQTSPDADNNNSSNNKARKRATKPRRKWSEEETNHLLLGVNRHGVGKWTSILEDSDFKFNDRTAGDLKDRFRTCCPDELRRNKASLGSPSSKSRQPKQKTKGDTHFDKILLDGDTSLTPEPSTGNEAETNPRQKKSRAHRKKMEDLVELGIHGPFKKSHRRERRPFTEQDDREILEGLNQHGPAWTKIQRDPRFHLASRQPTDLRDRVRNKYPSIYQRIEKGTFQVNDGGRGNDIMEPSINMSINNSLQPSNTTLEMQMNPAAPREDLPRWPLQRVDTVESIHSSQGFEFGESVTPQFMGGEMDISRLLLDDTQIPQGASRMGVDSFTGSSASTAIPESRREGLGKTTERAQHAF